VKPVPAGTGDAKNCCDVDLSYGAPGGEGHRVGDLTARARLGHAPLGDVVGPCGVIKDFVGLSCDSTHRANDIDRIDADRCFTRQHDSTGAVPDGVRDIVRFCTRGCWRSDHGLQHLRCRNNGLSASNAALDDLLLCDRQLFDGQLIAEIAAGNHDGPGCLDNAVEVLDRGTGLNLCHEQRPAWVRLRAHAPHVVCRAHKADGDHVDTNVYEGVQELQIVSLSAGMCTPG